MRGFHLQVLKERNFPYSSMKMLASARLVLWLLLSLGLVF